MRILKRRRDGHKQHYWEGSWKHKNIPEAKQKKLVDAFSKKSVDNVKLKDNHAIIIYDAHMLDMPIERKKHVGTIGNWKRRRTGIIIDSDVPEKHIKPLAVHEAVENYMGKRYGLRYGNAHKVATAVEKQFVNAQHKNWKSYQNSILHTKT